MGLATVSMSYGINPQVTVPMLLTITPDSVELIHVFRGMTGLYLGVAAFWLLASQKPHWHIPAIFSVIFFMVGMGTGRVISVIVDGFPTPILVSYIAVELFAALLGVYVLMKHSSNN